MPLFRFVTGRSVNGLLPGLLPRLLHRRARVLVGATRITAGVLSLQAGIATAATLTWDSTGTSPTTPAGGVGPWDKTHAYWSTGTVDQVWADGNSAVIGSSTANISSALTTTLNLSPTSITFNGGTSSINGGGFTLTTSASPGIIVNGSNTTLGTGTFVNGTASVGSVTSIKNGGVLTLNSDVILQTSGIAGDSSNATVNFNGVTLQPLKATTTFITGNTTAAITTGLTIDTSLVFSGNVVETDPLSGAGTLNKKGNGTLVLGADENGYDPVYNYSGTTTVSGGTLALDTSGNASPFTSLNPTGPFASTNFVVSSGATLSVWAEDAIAGTTGSTAVTINNGTLTTYSSPSFSIVGSAHLANVALNGGTISTAAEGSFDFLTGAVLHVTSSGTLSASTAFNTGAVIQVDPAQTLTVTSGLTDGDTNGQITKTGTGTVLLKSASDYSGDTTVSAGTLTVDTTGSLSGTKNITVAGGAIFNLNGTISSLPNLTVTGSATLGVNTLTGILARKVNAVTFTSSNGVNGSVTLAMATNHVNRQVLVTGALTFGGSTGTWTGQLNLANNDMDVQSGNLANLTNQIQQGFNGATWTGQGITSSSALTNTSHLTALGVILNNNGSGSKIYGSGTTLGLFDSQSPALTDVLVKYTYYGDANIDGTVDGSDYTKIDYGFLHRLTGWYNGDFNYDNKIDGSDYTLIDNAYNTEGGNLSSTGLIAASTAQIAGTTSVPEPASVSILGIALAGLLNRRTHRNRVS